MKPAVLFAVFSVVFAGAAKAGTNFLAAADFSDLAFFESQGVTYKVGGQVQDALQILKNQGSNCVRLRLWTSSQAQAVSDPYNHINNTNYNQAYAIHGVVVGAHQPDFDLEPAVHFGDGLHRDFSA